MAVAVAIYAPQVIKAIGPKIITGSKVLTGAIAGGLSNVAATGKLSSFGKGALTGALFAAAGLAGAGENAYSPQHFAAHAGAGCISAVANGGKCGQGAASALVGKAITGAVGSINIGGSGIAGDITRGIMASVGGGLAAKATGGSFSDGARTAAFGYLFNEMLTTKDGRPYKSTGRSYRGDKTLGGYDPRACLCSSVPPTPEYVYGGVKLLSMAYPPLGTAVGLGEVGYHVVQEDVPKAAQSPASIVGGYGAKWMAQGLGGKGANFVGHVTGFGIDALPKKPEKDK